MGNAFRPQPGPAIYPENKTPVAEDLLEVGLLVAFSCIAFSFVLIIPGIRGWERMWATIRVFVALFIGTVILVSNFGYEWYSDVKCVKTQYKAYVFPPNAPQEIEAAVGLHIGLYGINVTLKEMALAECTGEGDGSAYYNNRPFPDEDIDYNEAYRWSEPWTQGRLGFGRFAGRFNREFRASQFRGTPYPILWIAEYFTVDGEQIRWGRKFRLAGWYAHIFLWLAFALYLLAIILYVFVIKFGAIFTMYTGLVMILADFSYAIIIINDPRIAIPFSNGVDEVVLRPEYHWSFYLTLFTGIATFFIGLAVYIIDYFFPRKIAVVFHHSVVEEDDFFQVDEEEEEEGQGLEEYGVASKGGRSTRRGRGGTTRRGRSTRGISKYRQTQRKPRSTVRTSRGGSQRLHEEVQLEEIGTKE